jgi:hypothetical protein
MTNDETMVGRGKIKSKMGFLREETFSRHEQILSDEEGGC